MQQMQWHLYKWNDFETTSLVCPRRSEAALLTMWKTIFHSGQFEETHEIHSRWNQIRVQKMLQFFHIYFCNQASWRCQTSKSCLNVSHIGNIMSSIWTWSTTSSKNINRRFHLSQNLYWSFDKLQYIVELIVEPFLMALRTLIGGGSSIFMRGR